MKFKLNKKIILESILPQFMDQESDDVGNSFAGNNYDAGRDHVRTSLTHKGRILQENQNIKSGVKMGLGLGTGALVAGTGIGLAIHKHLNKEAEPEQTGNFSTDLAHNMQHQFN